MKVSDFDFTLPDELIARHPCANRTDSRLLTIHASANEIGHHKFTDVLSFIKPNDLLVFNDTKVVPARLFGNKESGGKVEILFERFLSDNEMLAHVRASKSPKEGSKLILEDETELHMVGRKGELFHLKSIGPIAEVLEKLGHMPLPPYIDREDELSDKERYQTVYAKHPGAAAAPTAGLHFDDQLLSKIRDKGASIGFVTLHVGAGTFQPVRVDDVKDHHMHSEWIDVAPSLVEQVKEARAKGGKIIAVGTTSLRSLESASQSGELSAFQGDTDIFIYPGYQFNCVDSLITNFHLPKSTLLMLVSAFAGSEIIKQAYHEAVEQKYRFFSYGDAMLLAQRQDQLRQLEGSSD